MADRDMPPEDWPTCVTCGGKHARLGKDGWVASCAGHVRYYTETNGERVRLDEQRPCRRPPDGDTPVCAKHGARKQDVRRKAANRVAARWGMPAEIHPVEAVLKALFIANGQVEFYGAQCRELEPDEMVWAKYRETNETGGESPKDNTVWSAGLHQWIVAHDTALERMHKIASDAVRIGIEAKQVEHAQWMGRQFASVLNALVSDPALRLSPLQQKAAQQAVVRHLRAVG